MAFNGSGVFNRIYNWVNDANASINITASRMDTEDSGFATGLSNAICKDGQTTITANLPMAGFKHTGVGNATLANHYAAYGQVQNSSPLWLGSSASTNTVTAGATPPLTAYAAGQTFRFLAGGTNTTAVTLNIDSLGAKAVQKLGAALIAGDITANNVCEVVYDGTQFQLCSPVPVNNAQIIGAALTGYSSGAGTVSATDSILQAINKLNGNQAAVTQQLTLLGTATASTSAALTFTSLISSAYTQYLVVFENLLLSTTANLTVKFSTNNGSTYAAAALGHMTSYVLNSSSAPSEDGSTGTVRLTTNNASCTYNGTANVVIQGSGTLTWWSGLTGNPADSSFEMAMIGKTDTGINAFEILPSAGTLTSGKVYLYGVKNT